MLSAETNDDLQELAQKIMPLLSEHSNNITLNEKLFACERSVQPKETLQLTQEQNSYWKMHTTVLFVMVPIWKEKHGKSTAA